MPYLPQTTLFTVLLHSQAHLLSIVCANPLLPGNYKASQRVYILTDQLVLSLRTDKVQSSCFSTSSTITTNISSLSLLSVLTHLKRIYYL